MNEPIILFRKSTDVEDELAIAREYFDVTEHRTNCKDQLVIPRYSALPFYRELETDLKNMGCTMINSYSQHRWIADFEYYEVLKEFTPETWTEQDFYRCEYPGPFVVKGRTNSRKWEWNRLMFAPTKKEAIQTAIRLHDDDFISQQGVLYRKYVPLKTFEIGLNGLPFTNEWRFFWYRDKLLSYGYYWSTADDPLLGKLTVNAMELAKKIASIAKEYVNFFVLDLAETVDGDWVLIEVNDGQMSGLSENDPHSLYNNLRICLKEENEILSNT